MTPWQGLHRAALKRRLSSFDALFLDDGGVMNDNSLRVPVWQQLIGEFMPPRLGGSAEQWSEANRKTFPPLWAELVEQMPHFSSHREFQRTYSVAWVRRACSAIGLASPADDDALALHLELTQYVWERADSAIPGAVDAVRSLRAAGHLLYTASGGTSWELRTILGRMDIADNFTEFYGPDLIDCVKYGAGYYEKLFDHAGIDPKRALVMDSDEPCCHWALEAGACAVWIDSTGRGDYSSLSALAAALA